VKSWFFLDISARWKSITKTVRLCLASYRIRSRFSLAAFNEEIREPIVMIMDTRMPYAFAGSHIPNSLSMWLGGTSVLPRVDS
jgi:hypothetical protein